MKNSNSQITIQMGQDKDASKDTLSYENILLGLKSNDVKTQIKSAKELFAYILNELKQVKREDDTAFIDSLISVIRELGKEQSTTADKQACILIIASIIYLDNINVRASKNNQLILFNQLRNFLLYCNDRAIIQMASRAMARLVMAGVECDNEFKTGLEYLENEQKRYAGIICLRELALASPSRLFLHSLVFYEDIQVAVHDRNLEIRQEAGELFRLSLIICISRESPIQRSDAQFQSRHALRRSSTTSSLNSQDSLHTSINSTQSSVQQSQQQQQQQSQLQYTAINDSLKYKCCFESSIIGLEQCLKTMQTNPKTQNLNEKIHGYLIIILEILKFSNLDFEKLIDKYLTAYMYPTDNNDHDRKTCEELHSKNLYVLLPQSYEPVTDPFLFLFKTDKINIKIESKNCKDLIKEKYDLIYGCINRLYVNVNNRYIQQIILQILPRLANFDTDLFQRKYLNDCILHLNGLLTKKLYKSDVLYCVGFMSLALTNDFQPYAIRFIDSIKMLFNNKDLQRKRISISTSAQTISSFTHLATGGGGAGTGGTLSTGSTLSSVLTSVSLSSSASGIGGGSGGGGGGGGIGGGGAGGSGSLLNTAQITHDDLNAILACVSMFATSMPNDMANSIMQLLEPLMLSSGGVTQTMRYCLDDVSIQIPQLRSSIHENLLKIISQILTGRPLCQIIQHVSFYASQLTQETNFLTFKPQLKLQISQLSQTGSESGSGCGLSGSVPAGVGHAAASMVLNDTNNQMIMQALQTLRSFDFTPIYTIAFLSYSVDYYLTHDVHDIKIEAVLTISSLLSRLIKTLETQESRSLISIISCTLRRLLTCAIIDNEADVRYYVLSSLSAPCFHMYIALPENLNILFMCIRDERVEIRELTASLISQLSSSNPAYILPFIRKVLMQLLTEIEIYPNIQQREASVRLIGHLLSFTPKLVNLYVKTLIDCLHTKLLEYRNDIHFASSIITVVGQLASQSSPECQQNFHVVIPFLLESMQDFYFIQLKHTSLWTLGQIVANTCFVIEPYRKYPSLLKILLDYLQTETVESVRRETIKILGLIGAIDPFVYKINRIKAIKNEDQCVVKVNNDSAESGDVKHATTAEQTGLDSSDMLISMNLQSSLEEYYPALAINLLMKIIKTGIVITSRRVAIQALVLAIRSIENRSIQYVELTVPPFLELIRNNMDSLVNDLLTNLSNLIQYIKKNIEPYVLQILSVVEFHWNQSNVKQPILIGLIELLQSLINVLDTDFKKFLPQVLPLVLKQLQREFNEFKYTNTHKLLCLLRSLSCCLEHYVHLFIQQFSEYLIINHKKVPDSTKRDILYTIYVFSKDINLTDNCSILFQAFVHVIDHYLNSTTNIDTITNTMTSGGGGVMASPKVSASTPALSTATGTGANTPTHATQMSTIQNGIFNVPASLTSKNISANTDIVVIVLETLYLIARQLNLRFFTYASMFDRVFSKNQKYFRLYEQLIAYCKDITFVNISNTQLSAAFFNSLHISDPATGGGGAAAATATSSSFSQMSTLQKASLNRKPLSTTNTDSHDSNGGGGGGSGGGAAGGGNASNSSNIISSTIKTHQTVNFSNLKTCMDRAEHLTSREGWRENFRKFMLTVVQETPVSVLRVCALITHDNVPPDLFNACFISIWLTLNEKEQNEVTRYLELTLKFSDAPDIIKNILNLAEFMERCDTGVPLPIEKRLLAEKAFHVRAYAKSLHYVEEQFNPSQPTTEILEQLVTLNYELQHDEAAAGVLDYANKHLKNLDLRVKERWYEKLHDWQKALSAYEKELNLDQPAALSAASANQIVITTDPKTLNASKLELLLGRMRCLKGLGDWQKLNMASKDILNCLNSLTIIKDSGATEQMATYLSPFDSYLGLFGPSLSTSSFVTRNFRRQLATQATDSQILLTQQQHQLLSAQVAEMGAAACWGLSDWDSMNSYVKHLPEKSYDGSMYRAILEINKENYPAAVEHITDTRDLLDSFLTSMASQSYDRAYQAIVDCQVLAELEEVIALRKSPEKNDIIRACWYKRLKGCERSIEFWHRLLLVHQIALPKGKDLKPWLKFSSLCQKTGHLNLAQNILTTLLDECKKTTTGHGVGVTGDDGNNDFEQCKYSYLKYNWASGSKRDSYNQLKEFVFQNLKPQNDKHLKMLQNIAIAQNNGANVQNIPLPANIREFNQRCDEINHLLSKCFIKLGMWQNELDGFSENTIGQILTYYQYAKEHNKSWYKAWNSWAYANYEAIQFYKNNNSASNNASLLTATRPMTRTQGSGNLYPLSGNRSMQQPLEVRLQKFIKPAIQGFFTCIKLSYGTPLQETNSLQDTLRLLTLWFDYGNKSDIYETLVDGINSTPMETWLQVIPQLIARIDTNKQLVAELIQKLLIDFGRLHPQALVYRLILASKCPNTFGTTAAAVVASNMGAQTARNLAAQKILSALREHCNTLVEQAKLVSEELIRVAILWHELWYESLEDASKLYFAERNVKGMFEALEVLHNMMDKGPTTNKENAFYQAYGRDLNEAREFCNRYKITSNTKDLDQAWDKYYQVFKRITRQLPQMVSLELSFVSPRLMVSRDLELAVPGTYEPNKPIVRIKSFHPNIQVIASKQRPRKISIMGSNGNEYVFLLKGHEDLRQDERVMQIFGLVNNLLLKNVETARRDLAIQRYSVIPLSQNSGLLEWLLNCDTLHSLIREYRERKKIALNNEHRIITRLAPDYEHLSAIQKVEIFETALELSSGDDLAKILWYKSATAEKWLERRTNYTRSLAVMSMVGYVLGLGDRHPSNLMLDRNNGKIIHVDFGDCFETAMNREKFPEKIPFRLTRMLKNAMEVTGLEGTFRRTCESAMKVLRNNRESVMAVLEAFVYDPLIYWRLIEGGQQPNGQQPGQNAFLHNSQAMGDMTANASSIATISEYCGSFNTSSTLTANNTAQLIDDNGEELNRKALSVLNRVKDKLTGLDFSDEQIDERKQVDLLIKQATSSENLCQCFIGWCAWW